MLVSVSCPYRVRQSLGRMFGFSLDVFSKMDAVGALGLEGRLLADYKSFATDYFRCGVGFCNTLGFCR